MTAMGVAENTLFSIFMEEFKMKAFMDKDFLLETETARKLFHDYAEKTPILDYHCHINPKEIDEEREFGFGGRRPLQVAFHAFLRC